MERTIRSVYQSDLRASLRARGVPGKVAVVDVECAATGTPSQLILCLGDIAATGEAHEVAPSRVLVRARRHGVDDFGFRVIPDSDPAR
jgi:hypothetical protein